MKRFATLLLSMGLLFGVVAATSVATASATPAVAQHHKDCYPNCAGTGGTGGSTTPSGSTTSPPSASIGAATGLAFTGADVAMTVGVAAVLVGIGLVLVRLSRRRVA